MQQVQSSVGSPLLLNEHWSRAAQGRKKEGRTRYRGAAGELGFSRVP